MASFDTDRVSIPVGVREEPSTLRCKKCRRYVVDSSCLHPASEELMVGCSLWHLNVAALPDWILLVINQVHWTRGKLNCQHCGARLGGFNFINSSRCPCRHSTTVHLIKSRVDLVVKHLVYLSRLDTARVHTGFQVNHNNLEDQVTHARNPETELQSSQIQATLVDGEPPVTSPSSCPLSLPLVFPIHEEVNEAASHDTDGHTRPTPDSVREETQDHACPTAAMILTKGEKNRLKSLRRKQRKNEHLVQRQLEEERSDEEKKEVCTCAVCLDVYYKPYMCEPCSHVFCEPCLRMMAKSRASNTPCPLCRTPISDVIFQEELHQYTRTHFPKEYRMRNRTFRKKKYSKWPLPSCPKQFHILRGLLFEH